MENTNFNIQDVVNITAELLGATPTDLLNKIGENEIQTADQLTSFLKPYAVKRYNDLRDESLNKGFRQASKKVERLWSEVFNEDITGKKLEDLFVQHREKYAKAKPTTADNITLQKALQSNEVKTYIDGLKAAASEAEAIKNEFNSFRNLQSIKAEAMNVLSQNGANFSTNPQIKARQIAALESELKALKFTKENKNIFVPKEKGQSGNAHGFTPNQIKTLGYEDFKRALNSGDTEKANFIQEQMIINHEQNL